MGDALENQDNNLNTEQSGAGGESAPLENEVEVVLVGDEDEQSEKPAPKRNPIVDMRKRIKEQNRENKEVKSELDKLRERLAQYENGQAPASAPSPAPSAAPTAQPNIADEPPTLEECGYDTTLYQQKMVAWNRELVKQTVDEQYGDQSAREQRRASETRAEAAVTAHYQRASELKVSDYVQAEDAAVEVLGAQLISSLQTTLDQSETLIYFLGKNPDKAQEMKELFDTNPGKATFALGQLSSKLTLLPKGKKPPNPDVPLTGGGGSVNASTYNRYLKQLNVAYDEGDINTAKDIRAQAKAEGITLPFNVS